MAWTEITRAKYERKAGRYQSDLTDAEWALLEPQMSGQPRKWTLREIVDAILYLHRSVAVADGADGGIDLGSGEALGVLEG